MFHLILPEPGEYFNVYFCSRVHASKFQSFARSPVVTSEIHSYLQNSNSTFFLIYADDYRRHTTSPSFTYSILLKTQRKHTTFHFSSTTDQSLPLSFLRHI